MDRDYKRKFAEGAESHTFIVLWKVFWRMDKAFEHMCCQEWELHYATKLSQQNFSSKFCHFSNAHNSVNFHRSKTIFFFILYVIICTLRKTWCEIRYKSMPHLHVFIKPKHFFFFKFDLTHYLAPIFFRKYHIHHRKVYFSTNNLKKNSSLYDFFWPNNAILKLFGRF